MLSSAGLTSSYSDTFGFDMFLAQSLLDEYDPATLDRDLDVRLHRRWPMPYQSAADRALCIVMQLYVGRMRAWLRYWRCTTKRLGLAPNASNCGGMLLLLVACCSGSSVAPGVVGRELRARSK